MQSQKPSFGSRFKRFIVAQAFLTLLLWGIYSSLWGKYLYIVTAYCDCPICVNVKKFQDHHFASGKKIYWGGVAADPRVRFGTKVEIVPHWPQDWGAVFVLLKGRRHFHVEDRGGKIKGKHIDLFIPDSLGGHQAALKWGVRRMRIKMNGVWAK